MFHCFLTHCTSRVHFPLAAMGNSSSKEKAALRQQVDALDKKYKVAAELKIAIEDELAGKKKEINTTTQTAEQLRLQVQGLEEKNAALQLDHTNTVSRLQNELSRELQGQLRVAESLTQERNRARQRLEQLENSIHNMGQSGAQESQELKQKAQDAQAEVEQVRAQMQQSTQSLETELEKVKTDNVELELKFKLNAADIEQRFQKEIAELQRKSQHDVAQLEQQTMTLNQRIENLEAELANAQASHAAELQRHTSTLKSEVVAAQTVLETSQQERSELRSQLSLAESQLADSTCELKRLHSGSQTVYDDLATARSALATSEQERRTLDEQLSSLQSQLEDSHSTLQDMQSGSKTVYDDLAAAKASANNLAAQLANSQRDLIAAKAAKDSLQRKHNEGVAKSSGHFEAFQALKLELSESQERYRALVQAQGQGVQTGYGPKSGLIESA